MEKIEKIECLVKGKVIKLTPAAFKIAKEYFGAERMDAIAISKPIELSKPLLIPKKPTLSQPIQPPVEKLIQKEVIEEKVVEPVVKTVAKKRTVNKAKK
jgi:hypothetical protein